MFDEKHAVIVFRCELLLTDKRKSEKMFSSLFCNARFRIEFFVELTIDF